MKNKYIMPKGQGSGTEKFYWTNSAWGKTQCIKVTLKEYIMNPLALRKSPNWAQLYYTLFWFTIFKTINIESITQHQLPNIEIRQAPFFLHSHLLFTSLTWKKEGNLIAGHSVQNTIADNTGIAHKMQSVLVGNLLKKFVSIDSIEGSPLRRRNLGCLNT